MFAGQLLEFANEVFPRGAVKDAVGWVEPEGGLGFALIMDPVRLQSYLDLSLERERGLWNGPRLNAVARRVFQHDRDLGFKFDRDVYLDSDFLERLGSELGIPGVDDVSVTVIPAPGYPWPTDGGVYYSAKKRRAEASPEPAWLNRVTSRGAYGEEPETTYGVNLCLFHGPVDPTERWRAGAAPDANRVEFENGAHAIVTHSMGQATDWSSGASGVRACGGFLWPSLAIGEVPASSFGPATLVAKVDVALLAVKPFKPRGVDVARIYDTDAWTWTLSAALDAGQRIAFRQLHGHATYMNTVENSLMVFGPPAGEGLMGQEPKVISTVEGLAREVKRRAKLYARDASPVQHAKSFMATRYSPQRYGYLEVKSNLNVAVSAFSMAVAADFAYDAGFTRFLDEIGFAGQRLVVPTSETVKVAFSEGGRGLLRVVVSEGVLTPREMETIRAIAGDESTAAEALESWVKVQFAHAVAEAVAQFGVTRRL